MSHIKSTTIKKSIIALACLIYSSLTFAVDLKDLKQLEAAENIEKVSQQITKAYFYIHQVIRVEEAKADLKSGLFNLKRNIKILDATSNSEQQAMVVFLSFIQSEVKNILTKPYSKENGAAMLDYSEALLEGAESVAKLHTHKKDEKEDMLITTEKMSFLLERITKYYIAFREGFDDHNNVIQLNQAVAEFEADLAKVKAFNYPDKLKVQVNKLTKYWPIAKKFYLGIEKNDLPLIVFISTQYMEKSLKILEKHHDKSLKVSKSPIFLDSFIDSFIYTPVNSYKA